MTFSAAMLWAIVAATPSPALLRQIVAETATAQIETIDPRWHPAQRDCAGLVRFAYREAFARLAPARLARGPWRDRAGRATAFADAETLLLYNFAFLSRQPLVPRELESGDLVAFRQQRDATAAPVYHLMVIVRPPDPAHDDAYVVYHPGEAGAAVRFGSLPSLVREAPREWQPVPENPAFLGFYRLREWMNHDCTDQQEQQTRHPWSGRGRRGGPRPRVGGLSGQTPAEWTGGANGRRRATGGLFGGYGGLRGARGR